MSINWTKLWGGSDDGTLMKGVDIRTIQDDLSVVISETAVNTLITAAITSDDIVSYNNEVQVYEDSVVRLG